ncbi:hypothetical protein ACJIZ3_004103 [Penstemon smallii]|uniref:Secreted protein n=1 Tax=Penstemon smallii TaxID=265156 RepID=A0ABD3S126_9LAMI
MRTNLAIGPFFLLFANSLHLLVAVVLFVGRIKVLEVLLIPIFRNLVKTKQNFCCCIIHIPDLGIYSIRDKISGTRVVTPHTSSCIFHVMIYFGRNVDTTKFLNFNEKILSDNIKIVTFYYIR